MRDERTQFFRARPIGVSLFVFFFGLGFIVFTGIFAVDAIHWDRVIEMNYFPVWGPMALGLFTLSLGVFSFRTTFNMDDRGIRIFHWRRLVREVPWGQIRRVDARVGKRGGVGFTLTPDSGPDICISVMSDEDEAGVDLILLIRKYIPDTRCTDRFDSLG